MAVQSEVNRAITCDGSPIRGEQGHHMRWQSMFGAGHCKNCDHSHGSPRTVMSRFAIPAGSSTAGAPAIATAFGPGGSVRCYWKWSLHPGRAQLLQQVLRSRHERQRQRTIAAKCTPGGAQNAAARRHSPASGWPSRARSMVPISHMVFFASPAATRSAST